MAREAMLSEFEDSTVITLQAWPHTNAFNSPLTFDRDEIHTHQGFRYICSADQSNLIIHLI